MVKRADIDPDEFAKYWHAGETLQQMASRFGVSKSTVKKFANRQGLPHRCHENQRGTRDPTPDEIARLAAELREKHFAERRAETDFATRARDWRQRAQIA